MGQVSARETKKAGGSRVFHNILANNIQLELKIEEFYSLLWKDPESLFYKRFLASIKCFDIKVEDWWLQQSTFTIHRNIYCKHKNSSSKTHLIQNVETIKEQTVTYNPVEKELTINEIVTYHNAPHADKFKIFLVWSVKEIPTTVVPSLPPVLQSNIVISSKIEFHESFKGKKLRAKIASELIEELQIEYYYYYQFAQELTKNIKNNRENFVLSEINKSDIQPLSIELPSSTFPSSYIPSVKKVSPMQKSESTDDMSSLSSISNPPQPDSSDDEPPRSVNSNKSKQSYSTSGSSYYGGNANPYLQCSVFVHYSIITYIAITSKLTNFAPVQLYDYLSVSLVFVCLLVVILRVLIAKIRIKKLINNFFKVCYASFGLLLHGICCLMVSSSAIPYYLIWLSLVIFLLLPIVITAFTTILKYNETTKKNSNFLNFVRIYILIAYTTLIQLPFVSMFLIPYFTSENMPKIQYTLLVNHGIMVVLLNNEEAARNILKKSYLLVLFGLIVHLVLLYLR